MLVGFVQRHRIGPRIIIVVPNRWFGVGNDDRLINNNNCRLNNCRLNNNDNWTAGLVTERDSVYTVIVVLDFGGHDFRFIERGDRLVTSELSGQRA